MNLNRLKKRMTKVRFLFMIKLTMGYFNVTSRHRMTLSHPMSKFIIGSSF